LLLSLQEGKTALILAAQGGHAEVVKVLLEGKADVDAKDTVWKHSRYPCFASKPIAEGTLLKLVAVF